MINQNPDRPVKILFKVISDCNRSCDFCFEKTFPEESKSSFDQSEIAANYSYFDKHFTINSAIMSGGEPTLHPEYFKILDFFTKQNMRLKIITNLIKFSDRSFSEMHKDYFKRNRDWEIYGSVHGMPLNETELNIVGLKNMLKSKIPVSIIVVAHKNNLVGLPRLIQYISKVFCSLGMILKLELRLLYIEGVCDTVMNQAPRDFGKLVYCFKECLRLLSNLPCAVTLWNFPVCYLTKTCGNLNSGVEARKNELILKVDKDNQLHDFKTRDFRNFFYKSKECLFCKLFENCSGINKKYIDDFKFPGLNPVIN